MKNNFIIILLLLLSVGWIHAEEDSESYVVPRKPPDFHFVVGPRIGVSYINTSPEKFSEEINEFFSTSGDYYPVVSYFGVSFEQRILLGNTRSHFAFQEIILISGIEQAIAIPSASFLIGFRGSTGIEFGTGPTFSLSGIGVVLALGWTFSYSEVYIPVDVSLIVPNRQRPMSFILTTGFNFTIASKYKD